VTIASNEYKYVATVELDLAALPPVTCHLGELNQVILNLVVNAAHAIADVAGTTEQKGKILIRTEQDGDDVLISVADTGTGIPEHLRETISTRSSRPRRWGAVRARGWPSRVRWWSSATAER